MKVLCGRLVYAAFTP
ncbi:hypothetical protein M2G44_21800 [Vibrio vulnificus]|nr:hypothetical protein [Vibrio vulnificus]MCU8352340.1 hypothetical protein [Vibrio vulnificus]MCU8413189.1 hypothetical protein [Vibrio vulnificus]MDS1873293.1 hypothetical protein [Vibrio vulnificus]MDT9658837.1 hypothetical protein [Vibrio vulnificus]